jgi:hypothetical protein
MRGLSVRMNLANRRLLPVRFFHFFISRTLGAPLPALIIAILLHLIGHVPLLWRVLVLCLQVVLTTVITVLIAIIVV